MKDDGGAVDVTNERYSDHVDELGRRRVETREWDETIKLKCRGRELREKQCSV